MPYLTKDAPDHLPTRELVESLMSIERDDPGDEIKALQDLTDEERKQIQLVKLSKRTERLQGDPYGTWQHWAGNLNHPEDDGMFDVLEPILDELLDIQPRDTEDISSIRKLLQAIPRAGLFDTSKEMADRDSIATKCDNEQETVICFTVRGHKVRLMQAKDLDVTNVKTYSKSTRAEDSASRTRQIIDESRMPIVTQQYLMAQLLRDRPPDFAERVRKANDKRLSAGPPKDPRTAEKSVFSELRAMAREKYWMDMDGDARAHIRQISQAVVGNPLLDAGLGPSLQTIKENWFEAWWKNDRHDPDYFENFLRDQGCARSVWPLIDDDVFVVVDRNLKVVMANIEGMCQLLFGEKALDLLDRAIDLWSYYCPLPLPETSRHVVDHYIRRRHPELDPAAATIETLPNAKMAVAHYGCWARQNDPQGRVIQPTLDTLFGRCNHSDAWNLRRLFPKFSRAVFGKAAALIRFLVKPLDPVYYQECVDIFENTPEDARMPVGEETFLTLFALGINGYTQRHRDIGDIRGGLAGLFTLGRYKGGNLCLPQLNLKVQYKPGACAVLRGNGLDHLVEDYVPPRWFVIGTNHEPVRRHARRRLGLAAPLPPAQRGKKRCHAESTTGEGGGDDGDEGYQRPAPCVNWATDADADDEVEWTNDRIHGPAVLPPEARGGN